MQIDLQNLYLHIRYNLCYLFVFTTDYYSIFYR